MEKIVSFEQFLELLRATPRDWYLSTWDAIRRNELVNDGEDYISQCPITSLANKPISDYKEVALQLGMSHRNYMDIVHAADADLHHNSQMRTDLLTACGLKRNQHRFNPIATYLHRGTNRT